MKNYQSFIINSKNLKKSSLGSTVFIDLNQSITLSKYCRVSRFSCYYTFPNIRSDLNNNTFSFTYNALNYLISLDNGLYSEDSLNETLNEKLSNIVVGTTTLKDLFKFDGDDSTGKITMVVKSNALAFSITPSASQNKLIREILGFSQTGTITINSANTVYVDGNTTALFNTVNAININCSFLSNNENIFFNNNNNSYVMQQVLLTAKAGGQVLYEPYHPQINTTNNNTINNFTIQLYDENNINLLDMNGDSFTLNIELYDE